MGYNVCRRLQGFTVFTVLVFTGVTVFVAVIVGYNVYMFTAVNGVSVFTCLYVFL